MSGLAKKSQQIIKDFRKASKGKSFSPEMKKAEAALKVLGRTAAVLDELQNDISVVQSKAVRAFQEGKLNDGFLLIKEAQKTHANLSRTVKTIPPLAKPLKSLITKDLKAKSPAEYRGLKVLVADIEALHAMCLYQEKGYKEQILDTGTRADKARNVEKTQNKALLQLDKALKRAVGAIQKIKANPTPETWDREFKYAGRDLKMAFVSLKGALKKGKHETFNASDAESFYQATLKWDTQKSMSTLPKDADEALIQKRLKAFTFIVKTIAKYCKRL